MNMNILKWMVVILLFGLAVIVSVQNYMAMKSPVNLVFFSYKSTEMPLAVVAILTFVLGVVSMGIYALAVCFRLKLRIRSLSMELRGMEKELKSLRNLPVTTETVGPEEPADI
jgi:uncharacterized integral membrane protein